MKLILLWFTLLTVSAGEQCLSAIKPKDPKIRTGKVTLKELKHKSWFKKEYRSYRLDQFILDSIHDLSEYKIIIYGGSWCSDTKVQLPRFIKVLDALKFPSDNLLILFADRKKQCNNCGDHSIEKYAIKFVPTFILVDRQGKEKGRIVELPSPTFERDLLRIMKEP